jgi:anthranilate synthase component 1
MTPDLSTFLKLAAANPGKLIPVTRSFLADGLTPVGAFRRMPPSPYAFLLESVERGELVGRYSFVGSCPDVIFRGQVFPAPGYTIEYPDGNSSRHAGDPLAALEEYLRGNQAIQNVSSAPAPPFAGGAVGYIGYDIIRLVEPRLAERPAKQPGLPGVPDMLVPIYRTILVFDHLLNTMTVVRHADPRDGSDVKAAYEKAAAAIEAVVERLRAPATELLDEIAAESGAPPDSAAACNCGQAAYMRAVERAKEYIAAGDIIQVVLSRRITRATKAAPFEVYRSLRAINPSPYLFYLHFGPLHLVGSSPEVLVRVEDGAITVRPIAGTRRRGKDAAEDTQLGAELLADPKERAEHIMLLDLGRNDVGRVSDFGSVHVDEQMVIEKYSDVMHIVSNVSGRMRAGLNAFDVLRACQPAGTLSGAPKIRAMEIIDELEPDRRGPYGGAIGVMDFLGNLNTAIAIRTFTMLEQPGGVFEAHVQVGAGIVADSSPASEYEETVRKARALLRALSAAEARMKAE